MPLNATLYDKSVIVMTSKIKGMLLTVFLIGLAYVIPVLLFSVTSMHSLCIVDDNFFLYPSCSQDFSIPFMSAMLFVVFLSLYIGRDKLTTLKITFCLSVTWGLLYLVWFGQLCNFESYGYLFGASFGSLYMLLYVKFKEKCSK